MHDELTAMDIRKMQEKIDYRETELRRTPTAPCRGSIRDMFPAFIFSQPLRAFAKCLLNGQ